MPPSLRIPLIILALTLALQSIMFTLLKALEDDAYRLATLLIGKTSPPYIAKTTAIPCILITKNPIDHAENAMILVEHA